jgi:hypothetical protein
VYNSEIMHWSVTQITEALSLKKNNGLTEAHSKIVSIFGQLFLALDWDEEQGSLLISDSYREFAHEFKDRFEVVTTNSDNSLYVMYSPDTHSLMQVYRDREASNAYEDYVDVNLSSLLPNGPRTKILGL